MARLSKATPARLKAICAAIEQGATYEHAAAAAGIALSTLSEWRTSNPQLSDALKAAEAHGVLACLQRIQQAAGSGQWQAAAWILERRYPQHYGRTIQQHEGTLTHEHSGPNGSPIPIAYFDASATIAALAAGSATDRASAGLAGLLDGGAGDGETLG